MKLDKNLLDQTMATKVLSRSIKQLGSRDWLERSKVFQAQDLTNDESVDLFSPENTCSLSQQCEVTKFLVRIGLDARIYNTTPDLTERYYLITFVPNAAFVEKQLLTADEARRLDKDFVRAQR